MKSAGETIINSLVSLDTPGKATVQVVILADPVSIVYLQGLLCRFVCMALIPIYKNLTSFPFVCSQVLLCDYSILQEFSFIFKSSQHCLFTNPFVLIHM